MFTLLVAGQRDVHKKNGSKRHLVLSKAVTKMSILRITFLPLVILSVAILIRGDPECSSLFGGSSGAFNYAIEKSINTDNNDILSGTLIRTIPQNNLEWSEGIFNILFSAKISSQSWAWAHSTRNNRKAAALAHIISCTGERDKLGIKNRRRSGCTARVNTLQNTTTGSRTFSSLVLRRDTGSAEDDRFGSAGCWCDGMCSKNLKDLEENESGPIQSYIVPSSPQKLLSSLRRIDNISFEWFENSILTKEPPFGQGIFYPTSSTSGTLGDVLRSRRIVHITKNVSDSTEGLAGPEPLETSMVSRVQQEMILLLESTLDSNLQFEPTTGSMIALTIASSLLAALGLESTLMTGRLYKRLFGSHCDGAKEDVEVFLRKAPLKHKIILGVLVILFELLLELLPISWLLSDEIRAQRHREVVGVEIIGAGNSTQYYSEVGNAILGPGREIRDMSSGIVLIVCRNTSTLLFFLL